MAIHYRKNGIKGWHLLEDYWLDTNEPAGGEKPNVPSDPDYAGEVYDPATCNNSDQIIACGAEAIYNGGPSFPNLVSVNLGSQPGRVVINFDSQGVPDKFIGKIGSQIVFNTGYRGYGAYQVGLNDALAMRGLPAETIAGGRFIAAEFEKISSLAQVLDVEVYAPMGGTLWNFHVACPSEGVIPYVYALQMRSTTAFFSGVTVDVLQNSNVIQSFGAPTSTSLVTRSFNVNSALDIEFVVHNNSGTNMELLVYPGADDAPAAGTPHQTYNVQNGTQENIPAGRLSGGLSFRFTGA